MVGDVPKESLCSQVGGIFATELSWGQVYEKEMKGYRIGRTVWKVGGKLRNKWSVVEKAGNVIIKLSDIGNMLWGRKQEVVCTDEFG